MFEKQFQPQDSIVSSQLREKATWDGGAGTAYWLGFFCRHLAVVREKETGLFLRMCARDSMRAQMKRQHHSSCRGVPGICHNNRLSSNEEATPPPPPSTNTEINSLVD